MQPKQYQIIDMWDIIIGMKSLPLRPTLPNAPLAVATKQAVVFNDMGSFFTWRQPSIKKSHQAKQNKILDVWGIIALLQTSTVATWVISTIATGEICPFATVIVPTGVIDVSIFQNSSNGHCWHHHFRCYYDILTLILKQMFKSHPSPVLDVLYMHRKIIR
jgi:hypothetical protein